MEYADNYSQSKHFLKRCLAGHFLQSGKVIGTSIGRRRSESPQGIGFHRRHPRFRNHHRKRCKRTDTRPDLFCRKPETTGREPDCHQRSLREEATRLTAKAQTVIWFADEENALAIAGITDRIKETSIRAVDELRATGIEVHMLTGDNEATAREIARKAGIAHYQASVLPQDKAAFISRLQAEGRKVAMVGDGINDSAALAQADLSIAMGGGSDIAMDVAKMTIISSDLTKIPEALRLSRLTVRTIRQNLFWAFIYNIVGVPIAAGILYPINGFLLNPMIAGAAMAFSSVSVVSNSLLLKRKKIHEREENKK